MERQVLIWFFLIGLLASFMSAIILATFISADMSRHAPEDLGPVLSKSSFGIISIWGSREHDSSRSTFYGKMYEYENWWVAVPLVSFGYRFYIKKKTAEIGRDTSGHRHVLARERGLTLFGSMSTWIGVQATGSRLG